MQTHWTTKSRRAGLLLPLTGLLLAALLAVLSGSAVLAQGPPPGSVTPVSSTGLALVNQDDALVERKEEGEFIARPVFSHELDLLYYGIRHPDTGDWLTATFRVHGGERRLSNGWQYTWEYPALDEQPDLDPEEAFLLVMFVRETSESDPRTFHALIPVHQPRGLWDRVLGALDPDRWARALARWVIEGVHGTICAVVEHAGGGDAAHCGGG